MKYIRSFNEEVSWQEVTGFLKDEITLYVSSLTDEYQVSSEDDYMIADWKKEKLKIEFGFKNIICDYDDSNFELVLDKFVRISKAVKRDFFLDSRLEGFYLKQDNSYNSSFRISHDDVESVKQIHHKMKDLRLGDGVVRVRFSLIIKGDLDIKYFAELLSYKNLNESLLDDVIEHYHDNDWRSMSKEDFDKASKIIKQEIDPFLFHITDEYQTTSDEDTASIFRLLNRSGTFNQIVFYVMYKNILVKFDEIPNFVSKVRKIIKIIDNFGFRIFLFWSYSDEQSFRGNTMWYTGNDKDKENDIEDELDSLNDIYKNKSIRQGGPEVSSKTKFVFTIEISDSTY